MRSFDSHRVMMKKKSCEAIELGQQRNWVIVSVWFMKNNYRTQGRMQNLTDRCDV